MVSTERIIFMNINEINDLLVRYELQVVDQRSRIINLRMQLNSDNIEAATENVKEFCKANEEIYLKLKMLMYEIQEKQADNIIEQLGTTDSFPASLEEIEPYIWKFHLPPFYSVSAKKKLYNEGKHIYYLVMNLMMRYEIDNKKIQKMEKPLVIFDHHICSKTDNYFDYDNIDSKRATDAMQGFFLKGDDASYLTVMHRATKDPEQSYCDIYLSDLKSNVRIKEKLADFLY